MMNTLLRYLLLLLLAVPAAHAKDLGALTKLTVGPYNSSATRTLTGPYQGGAMPFLQRYRNLSTTVQDSLAFTVQAFGPEYAQALQQFFGPLKGLSAGAEDTYMLGNIELPGPGSYLVQVEAFTYDRKKRDWISGPVQVYWLFPVAAQQPLAGPLPVELVSFTASTTSAAVTVSWQTAHESDVLRFEVQRSDDGRAFTTFLRQEATGGSAGKRYQASDRAPLGRVYYRLRVVNTDTTSQYSPVISVVPPRLVAQVYPNPARDQARVAGGAGSQATIYDAVGRLNREQLLDASEMLDLRGLAPGTYLLLISGQRTRLVNY
jgi:hypothetical protein